MNKYYNHDKEREKVYIDVEKIYLNYETQTAYAKSVGISRKLLHYFIRNGLRRSTANKHNIKYIKER